jgi:hypothetical protein
MSGGDSTEVHRRYKITARSKDVWPGRNMGLLQWSQFIKDVSFFWVSSRRKYVVPCAISEVADQQEMVPCASTFSVLPNELEVCIYLRKSLQRY